MNHQQEVENIIVLFLSGKEVIQTNKYLIEFVETEQAWTVCMNILCTNENDHIRFFASSMIHTKLKKQSSSITLSQQNDMLNWLVSYLANNINRGMNQPHRAVVKSILSSISLLILSKNQNGIQALITMGIENLIVSDMNHQQLGFIILTVFPFELSLLDTTRTMNKDIRLLVATYSNTILQIIQSFSITIHQQQQQQQQQQLMNMNTAHANNEYIILSSLSLLKSWLIYDITLEKIYLHYQPIFNMLLYSLFQDTICSSSFSASTTLSMESCKLFKEMITTTDESALISDFHLNEQQVMENYQIKYEAVGILLLTIMNNPDFISLLPQKGDEIQYEIVDLLVTIVLQYSVELMSTTTTTTKATITSTINTINTTTNMNLHNNNNNQLINIFEFLIHCVLLKSYYISAVTFDAFLALQDIAVEDRHVQLNDINFYKRLFINLLQKLMYFNINNNNNNNSSSSSNNNNNNSDGHDDDDDDDDEEEEENAFKNYREEAIDILLFCFYGLRNEFFTLLSQFLLHSQQQQLSSSSSSSSSVNSIQYLATLELICFVLSSVMNDVKKLYPIGPAMRSSNSSNSHNSGSNSHSDSSYNSNSNNSSHNNNDNIYIFIYSILSTCLSLPSSSSSSSSSSFQSKVGHRLEYSIARLIFSTVFLLVNNSNNNSNNSNNKSNNSQISNNSTNSNNNNNNHINLSTVQNSTTTTTTTDTTLFCQAIEFLLHAMNHHHHHHHYHHNGGGTHADGGFELSHTHIVAKQYQASFHKLLLSGTNILFHPHRHHHHHHHHHHQYSYTSSNNCNNNSDNTTTTNNNILMEDCLLLKQLILTINQHLYHNNNDDDNNDGSIITTTNKTTLSTSTSISTPILPPTHTPTHIPTHTLQQHKQQYMNSFCEFRTLETLSQVISMVSSSIIRYELLLMIGQPVLAAVAKQLTRHHHENGHSNSNNNNNSSHSGSTGSSSIISCLENARQIIENYNTTSSSNNSNNNSSNSNNSNNTNHNNTLINSSSSSSSSSSSNSSISGGNSNGSTCSDDDDSLIYEFTSSLLNLASQILHHPSLCGNAQLISKLFVLYTSIAKRSYTSAGSSSSSNSHHTMNTLLISTHVLLLPDHTQVLFQLLSLPICTSNSTVCLTILKFATAVFQYMTRTGTSATSGSASATSGSMSSSSSSSAIGIWRYSYQLYYAINAIISSSTATTAKSALNTTTSNSISIININTNSNSNNHPNVLIAPDLMEQYLLMLQYFISSAISTATIPTTTTTTMNDVNNNNNPILSIEMCRDVLRKCTNDLLVYQEPEVLKQFLLLFLLLFQQSSSSSSSSSSLVSNSMLTFTPSNTNTTTTTTHAATLIAEYSIACCRDVGTVLIHHLFLLISKGTLPTPVFQQFNDLLYSIVSITTIPITSSSSIDKNSTYITELIQLQHELRHGLIQAIINNTTTNNSTTHNNASTVIPPELGHDYIQALYHFTTPHHPLESKRKFKLLVLHTLNVSCGNADVNDFPGYFC